MDIVGLLVMDLWKRSLRIFIQRASHVSDDSCFRSVIGEEHPLVRHSVLDPDAAVKSHMCATWRRYAGLGREAVCDS